MALVLLLMLLVLLLMLLARHPHTTRNPHITHPARARCAACKGKPEADAESH
jgi:hypothetical protein